ncbi:MAG: hypothetical protein CXZ00_11250 [Acidobacteria bacterium]|nr:MAG: hypothetical protein CXZ00_11250 [Acidobacteriota bacterium]
MISRKLQYVIAALTVAIFVLCFYLVHLKRKAESMGDEPVPQAMTAPISGPAEEITLYVANDEDASLLPVSVSSAMPLDPGERGRIVIHTLITRYLRNDSPHPLGAGADVHDVYLLDPASAVVNLNAAFADSHRSGVEVEQLTVFSIVRTLKAQFPGLSRVRFLIEGKTRETLAGHIDISGWLDVAMVADASGELK